MQKSQDTQIRSLSQEDRLEEEMAPHSCLENPIGREAWQATDHGVTQSHTWLSIWANTRIALSKSREMKACGPICLFPVPEPWFSWFFLMIKVSAQISTPTDRSSQTTTPDFPITPQHLSHQPVSITLFYCPLSSYLHYLKWPFCCICLFVNCSSPHSSMWSL